MSIKEAEARMRRQKEKEIKGTLDFMSSWMFRKVSDDLNEYSKNADLYWIPVQGRKYLVINHYNRKRKIALQGFDLWLSEYRSDNDIGKEKAISTKSLKLCFKYPEHKNILEDYLPGK